jgi:hypothetical protein
MQATVAGTVVGVNYFLNRETRDALSTYEREYLHSAFQYTGGGLIMTALGARALFRSGVAVRIMSANPCESSLSSSTVSLFMIYRRGCSRC